MGITASDPKMHLSSSCSHELVSHLCLSWNFDRVTDTGLKWRINLGDTRGYLRMSLLSCSCLSGILLLVEERSSHSDFLSSWKDIASYFMVDVKTVQRWEKERGLPVRRIPGDKRGKVFAHRSELDDWVTAHKDRFRPPEAGALFGRTRLLGRILGVALLTLALTLLIWSMVATRDQSRDLDRVELRAGALVALDTAGKVAWTVELGARPDPLLQLVRWSPEAKERDVVAALSFSDSGGAEVVTRIDDFDVLGRKRWEWKPALDLLDFDGKPFEPTWWVSYMLSDTTGDRAALWVSIINPLRWASGLFRLDSKGKAVLQFANAGHIQRICRLPKAKDSRFLISGINNAFDVPFIAEIDPNGMPGFSPPGGPSRYNFVNNPEGHAIKYVLFPKSEIHEANGEPYFNHYSIRVAGSRIVATLNDWESGHTMYNYEFSEDLTPLQARLASTGALRHGQLEAAGKLNHSLAMCPEMNNPHRLRVWSASTGWTEVSISVASRQNVN